MAFNPRSTIRLEHAERDRVQAAWTYQEDCAVVWRPTVNAFGHGDRQSVDVRTVVHLEPPPDMERYYQEAGRQDGMARAHMRSTAGET